MRLHASTVDIEQAWHVDQRDIIRLALATSAMIRTLFGTATQPIQNSDDLRTATWICNRLPVIQISLFSSSSQVLVTARVRELDTHD